MMAARSVTPGGALLRASRVFAIPPPLPKPTEQLSSKAIFMSETATTAHPIRLSITTPQASLARGDWGFKRPLPLRSTTKTSTPLIRVEAIDTYEHITEYASSADHTINMQKWLEMGIPLTVPVVDDQASSGGYRSEKRQSVFEDKMDYTTGPTGDNAKYDIRWKFNGPFLATQTEGDFVQYVSREVKKRKGEFREYLKVECAKALTTDARKAATEEMPAAISAEEVTEEQLTAFVKEARRDRSDLFRLIRSFLDLPPVAPPSARSYENLLESLMQHGVSAPPVKIEHFATSLSPYAAHGPPKTHPSAGLSYARSAAYTPNHPQFGPQKTSPVIKARVVRPKGGGGGSFGATLGVGGFVTDLPAGADSFNTGPAAKRFRDMSAMIPGALQIEPDKVGGSKTYVHAAHATVNPKGQIVLTVESGDAEAIAVLEGKTDSIPAAPMPQGRRPMSAMSPRGGSRKLGGYGLGGTGRAGNAASGRPAQADRAQDPASSLSGLLGIEK